MRLAQYLSILLASLASVAYAMTAKELSSMASSNNIIKITDNNFEKILMDRQDYTIVIYITATSARINCVLCTELAPLINNLASSYKTNLDKHPANDDDDETPNIFFGIADFTDNKKYFNRIGLESVPKLYLYSPTARRSAQNILSYNEFNFVPGDHYNKIISFIVQYTKAPLSLFEIHEPVDYTIFFTRIAFTALAITTVYKSYYKFDKVFRSSYLYRILSLFAIFSFTAGFMFNQIRQTPYSRENNGETTFILPGHQQQLGAETQIISALYFALFLSCWFLITKANSIKNAKYKLISVIALNICIFIFYSMVINVYRIKNGGYPFALSKLF